MPSNEHQEMKKKIYNQLKQIYDVTLEVTIGKKYITDVLLSNNNYKIAIECQCSPVNTTRIRDKNLYYIKHNIIPLWIFGGEYFRRTNEYKLYIRNNFYNRSEYKIQRIIKLHKEFLDHNIPLYLYGNNRFWQTTNFNYRYNSESLGWYYIKETFLVNIISNYYHFMNNFIKYVIYS